MRGRGSSAARRILRWHLLPNLLLLLRGAGSFVIHHRNQCCCVRRLWTPCRIPSQADESVVSVSCFLERPRAESLESSTLFVSLSYDDARGWMKEGEAAFRRGDVKEATQRFDDVYDNFPALRPYLWQRGISLYYEGRYREASDQFHLDVRVNPNDVEEVVWDAASLLRLDPESFPPKDMMSVASPGNDRRRIMTPVYLLFQGKGSEHDLFVAGHSAFSSPADEFYSLLYLGLYCEARNETTKARSYMLQSLRTAYATDRGRSDYMTAVARVHCRLRGWT